MANLKPTETGSSDDGLKTIQDLYNMIGGGGSGSQTTSGGTVTQTSGGGTTEGSSTNWQDAYTDSSSETVHSSISAEGLNSMLKNILEGTQGLAAVSAGQRGAGGYAASTNTLLLNDLMARAAGQVAQNDKTTVTNTVRNVSARGGGSHSFQVQSPSTTVTTKEPTTTEISKSNSAGSTLGKAMLGLSAWDKIKKLTGSGSKTVEENFGEQYVSGGDLGPGMSDQAARNDAFDGGQTATELSVAGNYIEGGNLGPGPMNFAEPNEYMTDSNYDLFSGFDEPVFDEPVFDIPQFDDIPTDVDIPIDVPELPEWDFDFADGGSVAKKINNQIGFQSNKLADLRAGAAGTGASTINPDVVAQATREPTTVNSVRTPTATRAAVPTRTVIGKPDSASVRTIDTSAVDEDGTVIQNYDVSGSRGGARNENRINPNGGLNAQGQNPDANRAVNVGLGIAGAAFPALGTTIAASNFAQKPSVETGISLLNRFAKIPGLNVAVKAFNALTGTTENAESPSHVNDIRKFELSKLTENKDIVDAALPSEPVSTPAAPAPDAEDESVNAESNQASPTETDAIVSDLITSDEIQYDVDGNPIPAGSSVSGSYRSPSPINVVNASAGGDSMDGGGESNSTTYAADGVRITGKVSGPGTEVSDSIDAKLSVNEYVLPADVVEAIGIDKLDSLVKKYHTPASIQKLRGGR